MVHRSLSKEEIKKRLIRLRNVGYLHEVQRFKIWFLRDENRALKKEIKALKLVVGEQQQTINDLKLQVEELRTMVFGRKKKKDGEDDDLAPPQTKIARTNDSYHRPVPKAEMVTEVKSHHANQCFCGAKLVNKQIVTFYEEDIPLPVKKMVRKHFVEKGYCQECQQWRTALPLPNTPVILGQNVQKYICYLNVMCRLSFSQIKNVLQDTYQFPISEGEITKLLAREAIHLRPFFEQLKARIRGEPGVHLDETSWKLLQGGDTTYAWVMSGIQSQESVFLLGESRGKDNAEKLLGENYEGFVVTDDYGAYRKLSRHQLCWAHLIRKFRDLAQSGELVAGQRKHCREEYAKLSLVYEDLKKDRSHTRANEFNQRLTELSTLAPNDPEKLIRIKTTPRKNISNYLTCLTDPLIPLTNNQAERALRHLVLKRKISFGFLTKRTAENLAGLLSVLMSLKQRYQSNFFGEYLKV